MEKYIEERRRRKKEVAMVLTDITKIIRVLLVTFEAVASKDELTQRRIDQIGEVIGAVEGLTEREEAIKKDGAALAARRVDEAHDVIHRIAAILAMEDGEDVEGGDEGSGGDGNGKVVPGSGLMAARETAAA